MRTIVGIKNFLFLHGWLLALSLVADEKALIGSSNEELPGHIVQDIISRVDALNEHGNFQAAMSLVFETLHQYEQRGEMQDNLRNNLIMYLRGEINEGSARIAHNNHDIDAFLKTARAFAIVGDRFQSMEVLTHAVTDNPHETRLWMMVGGLEMLVGRDGEALSVYREVIRLNDKLPHAYNNAAFLLAKSGKESIHNVLLALEFSKKAVALAPNDPEFLDTLAEIFYQVGDRKQAIATINRAIKLAPNEPFFEAQLSRFKTANYE